MTGSSAVVRPSGPMTGEDTVLAVIGRDDRIPRRQRPAPGEVNEVLWTRGGKGPYVKPFELAYSPVTDRCIFAGNRDGQGFALYALQRGKAEPPERLEKN